MKQRDDQAIEYSIWGRRSKDAPPKRPIERPRDFKARLKQLVLRDPEITTAVLLRRLRREGVRLSSFTVSNIRRDFMDDLKLLRQLGHLREK